MLIVVKFLNVYSKIMIKSKGLVTTTMIHLKY